jgi:hypothetical protein
VTILNKNGKPMTNVVQMKGSREAPKSQRSSMETLIVSIDQVNQWQLPPCQRPLRVNAKVLATAEEMKANPCIEGVVTLGRIGKSPTLYVVDGQHRIEAFRISSLPEAIVDVRIVHFDDMADLADEFVRLNTALVRMRPDDVLRGLEATSLALTTIRRECPFVGYDFIRRNGTSGPVVSMNSVLRCWYGSAAETPTNQTGGNSVAKVALSMDQESIDDLVRFLSTAQAAWGRDPEYYRLWANLNICLCMWLWRRVVVSGANRGAKRAVVLNAGQFRQCLMQLSADARYLEWLQGRTLSDRDRSPGYQRIKDLFAKRLMEQDGNGKKPMLPAPSWFSRR